MLEAFLSNLTIGKIAGGTTLLIAGIMSIIQVSKIEIDPWSRLFGWIGRAINGEIIAKVDKLGEDVQKLRDEADEREAKAARSHILQFGDECLHDVKHSKERFDQVMRDIKEYETYCDEHPNFENGQAIHTIAFINDIYRERMRDHDFL